MSAHTHPRPADPAGRRPDSRLPWWALALPALAFAALLLLVGSSDAHAADGSGTLSQVFGLVRGALTHQP
ncbi:hypothetical protein B7755_009035 [Streptomyces sp. NBS 14/10]|uniref:hypothetical protein n=1 Tax=Streptomyces sp. NBS 14/10 TaxID=1945643 RepID=UPI000B7CFF00|nr:hypothetical protein [Streptomyces sp. NBS 14/10]KAK1178264.1 hypothetical protein B7755_009035 [Streptomyces sp. NBS 14/10]NUP45269.1 hypothetical protein [Streptomyces sp.]NUS81665.1 hypothetical protein [Streptomyces sp.]